jgi:hypothetical protein
MQPRSVAFGSDVKECKSKLIPVWIADDEDKLPPPVYVRGVLPFPSHIPHESVEENVRFSQRQYFHAEQPQSIMRPAVDVTFA